jgi:hypothetical protein
LESIASIHNENSSQIYQEQKQRPHIMNTINHCFKNFKFSIKILFYVLLSLLGSQAVAQQRWFDINIPYNQKWEISDQKIATYYRQGRLVFDKASYFTGAIKDFYKSGKLQMEGHYDEKGLKQGLFTYYYENGVKEREGTFIKDDMKGIWSYYDAKGDLIAKANCVTHNDFTPLFYRNKRGEVLIKDGNGKFMIDLEEYPELIWTSADIPIKYMGGTVTNGLREGEWKYYSMKTSSSSEVYKGNRLSFNDLYKGGKFRYGNAFILYTSAARYRVPQTQLTLFPKKDIPIGQFTGDYAFGTPENAGKAIYSFFFANLKPSITSASLFYKNNFKDYINCVEAAMHLTTDYELDNTPDLDYEKDNWVFFNKTTVIQPNQTVPASGTADLKFNVMSNGDVKNINIESNLPDKFVKALSYYFSILKNQSPKPKEDSSLVQLKLSLDHEVGYKESVKSFVSYGTLSAGVPDLSYKKYLVKDSLILTAKPPVFPAGQEKWNEFLKDAMKKIAKIVPEQYRDNIYLTFIVDENGLITDIATATQNDYDPKLLQLTMRILKNSPRWTPATLDGKNIKYQMSQTFQYVTEESRSFVEDSGL